jgi:hypothetical protein
MLFTKTVYCGAVETPSDPVGYSKGAEPAPGFRFIQCHSTRTNQPAVRLLPERVVELVRQPRYWQNRNIVLA